MRQYRIVAPGFVVLHLMVTRSSGCMVEVALRSVSLTRQQSAELLRNARSKGYSITRTMGV
jgi:hypothetical protein